jgi:hypothetical protein
MLIFSPSFFSAPFPLSSLVPLSYLPNISFLQHRSSLPSLSFLYALPVGIFNLKDAGVYLSQRYLKLISGIRAYEKSSQNSKIWIVGHVKRKRFSISDSFSFLISSYFSPYPSLSLSSSFSSLFSLSPLPSFPTLLSPFPPFFSLSLLFFFLPSFFALLFPRFQEWSLAAPPPVRFHCWNDNIDKSDSKRRARSPRMEIFPPFLFLFSPLFFLISPLFY